MNEREPERPKAAPFDCPHCGAAVPHGAAACPECGSDSSTGWAEDADTAGAGIAGGYGDDDDFDYDEFVEREFGGKAGQGGGLRSQERVFIVIVLVIVAAALVYFGIIA